MKPTRTREMRIRIPARARAVWRTLAPPVRGPDKQGKADSRGHEQGQEGNGDQPFGFEVVLEVVVNNCGHHVDRRHEKKSGQGQEQKGRIAQL